jgi:hypothetical protein
MQSTNLGVVQLLTVIDPMLHIGSLLIVAYNRKTDKLFTSPASMVVPAVIRPISSLLHCKAMI